MNIRNKDVEKMTNSQIVDMLERCVFPAGECDECPCPQEYKDDCKCFEFAMEAALALTVRQTEALDAALSSQMRLQNELDTMQKRNAELSMKLDLVRWHSEENERLHEMIRAMSAKNEEIYRRDRHITEQLTDFVKEKMVSDFYRAPVGVGQTVWAVVELDDEVIIEEWTADYVCRDWDGWLIVNKSGEYIRVDQNVHKSKSEAERAQAMMMNNMLNADADHVEHRGIVARQSVYNNYVMLKSGNQTVREIVTDCRRRSVEEMKAYIDEYLDGYGTVD